jgi:iron complex transport system substrate-binding protein
VLSSPGLVALIVGLGLATACGGGTDVTPDPASPLATVAEESAPADAFPLTVVDDEGTSVEISGRPERIVSLTPGTTEILFAIGAGERVVATTDADDYPPKAVPLPNVASFGTVDLERLVGLEPDVVFAGGNAYTPPDAIGRLRDLSIPVVVIYASTVAAVAADVELVGAVVGESAEAAKVAETMRAEIAAISEATADAPRPRVFYEIDASAGLFGPADDSFLAQMIELAGGEPITTGSSTSFEMDLERLVAMDPEVIVLGDIAFGATPEQVAARPAWDGMTAVREGAIRGVDDKLVTRPGPRLPLGLRSLTLAIHPDARLP